MGVDEHKVVKTLVMEDENRDPFIVLMHGDKRVSTKRMAKAVTSKSVRSVSPKEAQRCTGYVVGGISPFGTRRRLPVYIEESILSLDTIYVNAGRRGFLVQMKPQELERTLDPTPVNVAL